MIVISQYWTDINFALVCKNNNVLAIDDLLNGNNLFKPTNIPYAKELVLIHDSLDVFKYFVKNNLFNFSQKGLLKETLNQAAMAGSLSIVRELIENPDYQQADRLRLRDIEKAFYRTIYANLSLGGSRRIAKLGLINHRNLRDNIPLIDWFLREKSISIHAHDDKFMKYLLVDKQKDIIVHLTTHHHFKFDEKLLVWVDKKTDLNISPKISAILFHESLNINLIEDKKSDLIFKI